MSKIALHLIEHPKVTLAPIGDSSIKSFDKHNSLSALAESLKDDLDNEELGINMERSNISLPSPWANFLTFNTMLFSGADDTTVKKANEEWKSLLLLIILKPVLDIDITYTDIDLKSEKLGGYAKKFCKNLITVMPETHIFEDGCWSKIRLIKINGIIIGAFSNTSLVCSSYNQIDEKLRNYLIEKGYPNIFNVVNKKDGSVNTYLSFDGIMKDIMKNSGIKCHYVLQWLETMENELSKIANKKIGENDVAKYCNALSTKIDGLKKELTEKANDWGIDLSYYTEKEIINGEEITKQFANVSVGRHDYENVQGLFDAINLYFDFTLKRIENEISIRDMKILAFNNLDKDLIHLLEKPDIVKLPQNKEILIPDKIFNDVITLLAIPAGQDNKDDGGEWHLGEKLGEGDNFAYYVLTPIRFDAMKRYFADSSYELKSKIKYNANNDFTFVSAEIKLNTQALDYKNEPKDISIPQTYDGSKIRIMYASSLPLISIWPYRKLNDISGNNIWKKYYFYLNQRSDDEQCSRFSFNCDIASENTIELNLANANNISKREIRTYNDIPKYIEVYNDFSGEMGVILLCKPKTNTASTSDCVVGLDFGTTSTTAFYKKDNTNTPQFIKLGKTYSHDIRGEKPIDVWRDENVYSGLEEITMNALLDDGKMSDYGVMFPGYRFYDRMAYPSLFITTGNQSALSADNPLTHGSCILNYYYTNVPIGDSVIDDNLKWSTRNDTSDHINGYLSQMMLSIVYNLISEIRISGDIKLRYSYPTALPVELRENFETYISNISNSINNNILDNGTKIVVEGGQTESIAAAMNFRDSGGSCFVCVDIGGGSSDISAWHKRADESIDSIMQTSINMASRDIFRPAFSEIVISDPSNPPKLRERIKDFAGSDYIGPIFDAAVEKYNSGEKGSNKENQRIAIDLIGNAIESVLFEYSDQLVSYMPADKNKFQRKILFGLYSILYFTVASVAKAMEDRNIDKSTMRTMKIFLAGNGSKLYTWITRTYMKKLKDVITEIGLDFGVIDEGGRIDIIEPDFATLKTEAAKGLLANDWDKYENDNEMVYNGETIYFTKKDGSKVKFEPDMDLCSDSEIINFYKGQPTNLVEPIIIESDEDMRQIKSMVNIFNEQITGPISSKMKIQCDRNFWLDVYQSAQGILSDNIKHKQMTSTLMIYAKAVIKNI